MNGAFNSQILVEKFVKLNHTQQSIETLSHWCIFHRKKAAEIVDTWAGQFHETPKELQVPFLYLANDILQNSRRKGGEFVHEFWRVLPGALKAVLQNGDEKGRNAVLRLVDIWEDRKVFGSRVQSLRQELLGKDIFIETSGNEKARQCVGGLQEKLHAAYQYIQDVSLDEEAILGRCNNAAIHIEGLGREADLRKTGGPGGDSLADELQEQQNILVNCVEQLEKNEGARAGLIEYLKEALRDQESKIGLIRNQLQIAQAQSEYAGKVRKQLLVSCSPSEQYTLRESFRDMLESNGMVGSLDSDDDKDRGVSEAFLGSLPGGSDGNEERQKSAAAEIAAKLTASASSAQMLTSVLSSLVATEEVAPSSRMLTVPIHDPQKRQRLDESAYNSRGDMVTYPPLPPPPPPPPLSLPPQQPSYLMSSIGGGGMNAPQYGVGVPHPLHLSPFPAQVMVGMAIGQGSNSNSNNNSNNNRPPQQLNLPPPTYSWPPSPFAPPLPWHSFLNG